MTPGKKPDSAIPRRKRKATYCGLAVINAVATETAPPQSSDERTEARDDATAPHKADQLAASISSTKGYIIALEGGTDSVGSADYNYDLSQRRANSVIQYLASKYSVPAHKIYVIGLGKDKPVETNKTSSGRADNRRVDVRLMTNTLGDSSQPASAPATGTNSPSSM